ncbi:MAG: sugar metabolism transcriptional regulator [Hyphomicrobiales bacterium]|nr:MAG: sugar metabolism transcriptional regulator [Hyphomicrobiales bacterium]
MLLSELNAYFASHKRACMSDLVNRFNASPEALRGMLDMLMAKHRIARTAAETNCSGCTKCDPGRLEIYEWRGQG